jgi:hypothetical protein
MADPVSSSGTSGARITTTADATGNAQVDSTAAGQPNKQVFNDSGFHGPSSTPAGATADAHAGGGEVHAAASAQTKSGQAASLKGGTSWKGGSAEGEVDLLKYGASASASFDASAKNLSIDGSVKVHVEANLISAHGAIHQDIPVTIEGQKMHVKVDLTAQGALGLNGDLVLAVHMGQDGARVTASMAGNLANASVGIKVEVDDDKRGELGEVAVTAGVAYGLPGVNGGSPLAKGFIKDGQNADGTPKTVGTKAFGANVVGTKKDQLSGFGMTVPLGPVKIGYSAKINTVNVAETGLDMAKYEVKRDVDGIKRAISSIFP